MNEQEDDAESACEVGGVHLIALLRWEVGKFDVRGSIGIAAILVCTRGCR